MPIAELVQQFVAAITKSEQDAHGRWPYLRTPTAWQEWLQPHARQAPLRLREFARLLQYVW